MKLFTIAFSTLTLITSTNALGINCRGSGWCSSSGAPGNLLNVKAIVDNIQPRDRRYTSGQQIACSGLVCALYQKDASGTAEDTSRFLENLLKHGCKKCGSIPTQPGNNVYAGQLTVNVVNVPQCQGAC